MPDIRVGLATGSAISRLGDVFGPPVNLAARLSHVARSNRVLVDEATAATLGDEFDTRTLPPRPLRGFGNVSPITVTERRGFRSR
jgi:adenylate cyclase